MSPPSLESAIQSAGSPVKLLRNSQAGPYVYPVKPPEYSNWRDEQRGWFESAVLFNQSYHMSDGYVEGPDAFKLLESLGINSFKGFEPNKAKQYVVTSYDGYVIGDVVLFYLAPNQFNLVGRPSVHNWVQYHIETGTNPETGAKWNATIRRDERAAARAGSSISGPGAITREAYRYQVQGPNALKIITKVTGKPVPDIKFFNMTEFTIAGRQVRALRHGMAGQAGFELFGPWADGDAVREALIEAGKEFNMRLVGARAYSSNTLESGWVPSPLPAIYTGEKMKPYREWLAAASYEGTGSLGGSFVSENIEDYYLTPYDLTYGPFVKFDHEFIGKEALQKLNGQGRKKVTLELNSDDVIKAIGTMAASSDNRAKFWDWPSAVYSTWPYDRVLKDGKTIGVSTWVGYTQNFGKFLTLAMLAPELATPGTEVTFEWGEPNSTRPTVEKHHVVQLRAVVQPTPYSDVARIEYASGGGWRAGK